jgi:very-short-patch-repair endonuclease
MRPYGGNLKGVSRKLRKGMTEAEQLLWSHLRRKQILDIQFYRQKPVGPYVVDFYASKVHLVIEVDGSQHSGEEQAQHDVVRDLFLCKQQLAVLRFDNRQVLLETGAVLDEIFRVCRERQIPPVPPLQRGGPSAAPLEINSGENELPSTTSSGRNPGENE